MVRMCSLVTLACATALAAGSASAAEKTIAPGSARQAVNNVVNNLNLFAGTCDCTWHNGDFDGRDGQVSHLGGAVPHGMKAADDFYLCEGYVYDLQNISGRIMTTTLVGLVKPRLEIWSDCNGAPGTLLYTLEKATVTETGQSFGTAFDGRPLRIVDATFTLANETKVENKNIVLKGGTYWISLYGTSDNQCPTMQMCDVTYWGTAGNQIVKGSPAMKIDGVPTPSYNQFNFPGPWRSVLDDCCVGCTDLNFTVCANACKILIDNGEGRRGSGVIGSTSQFAPTSWSQIETRSADDFVVPPCADTTICYVEGCVLTNCVGFWGVFELYANDCNKPSYSLGGQPLGGQQYLATKVIPLNYSTVVDGQTLNAFKLEFHDLNITLTGGRQYWISVGVKHTFSINERAQFCFNADCERSCLIRFNEGRVLTAFTRDIVGGQSVPGWAKVGNDFAFLIGANSASGGAGNATPTCVADFNRDGQVSPADIFDYLNAWFTGCP